MVLKAIGFDLDDTLYSRKEFYQKVFEVMQSSVLTIDVTFNMFYKKFQVYSDIEYEKFIRREKNKTDYKNDRVIDTYNSFNEKATKNDAIIFNSLYLYFRDTISYREGAEELLDYLKVNNYDLFILTNGPSTDQQRKLEQLGIEKYISKEKWFISDELNYTKPEEEIFKIVEKVIGYQGEEILYIGDDLENDITGAQKLNWQTIYLDVHNILEKPKNTENAKDFDEILTILK